MGIYDSNTLDTKTRDLANENLASLVGLSIVVPCYNEEVSLPLFMEEITKVMSGVVPLLLDNVALIAPVGISTKKDFAKNGKNISGFLPYEIIFVNDGSRDKTLQVLDDIVAKESSDEANSRKIHIHSFSRNFGKEAAILAGLGKAQGQGVVLIDADLQDPPRLIGDMVRIWLESKRETKIIYARRTTRAGESKVRAFLSEMFYKVSNFISEVKIESGVRDFRLMDREVIASLLQMGEYHRFCKAMFAWVGYKRECLEYEYIPHIKESSSWSFWKLFKYAIEGIVSFSTMPLRIAFVLGFIISAFAAVFGVYRIIDTIIYGNAVAGYPSLIVIITFIGGIQLMILGVIGEYIARIYEQVKSRPHFILEHRNVYEGVAYNPSTQSSATAKSKDSSKDLSQDLSKNSPKVSKTPTQNLAQNQKEQTSLF